jgi:hypothetical protein
MSAPDTSLMYMIHHVFLPPKLPKHGDARRFAATDRVLLRHVLDALRSFARLSTAGQNESIRAVDSMVEKMISLTDDEGHIQQKLLLEAFTQLPTNGKPHLASFLSGSQLIS